MMNESKKTALDSLKDSVDFLKIAIILFMKQEKKLMSMRKKAKSQNDIMAIIGKMKDVRKQMEMCRLALDDLTYGYIERFPQYSGKLLKKLHYQTAEGYLLDKQDANRPSIQRIIETITRINTGASHQYGTMEERLEPLTDLYNIEYTKSGYISIDRKPMRDLDYQGPKYDQERNYRENVIDDEMIQARNNRLPNATERLELVSEAAASSVKHR